MIITVPDSLGKVLKKRKLMTKIHICLESFDFVPSQSHDNVLRVQRQLMTLDDGEKYEGEWDKNGKKDGKGIQILWDGSLYDGFWKVDKRNGRGLLIKANDEMQIGEWKDDKYHGYGKYYYVNGEIYEG